MTKAESIASGPNHEVAGLALGFVAVVIFAATLPLTRIALVDYSPWFISFGRAMIATMAASVLLLVLRRPLPRQHFTLLILAGALLIFGFPCMMAIALQTVPSAHGGVVLGILPLATAAASVLFAGERPSLGFWLCGMLGSAAVMAFALIDNGVAALRLEFGDLLLIAAVAAAAIGYAQGAVLAKRLGGWQTISWCLVLSAPFLALGVTLFTPSINWGASLPAWGGFFYVAIFSQFLGFFAWYRGLALGGIARVGQVQLLQPFITLVGAVVLLGEQIGVLEVGFAILVVALVALGRQMRVARA